VLEHDLLVHILGAVRPQITATNSAKC
jgi:hypothetical protein